MAASGEIDVLRREPFGNYVPSPAVDQVACAIAVMPGISPAARALD